MRPSISDRLAGPPRPPQFRLTCAPFDEVPPMELPPPALLFCAALESADDHDRSGTLLLDSIDGGEEGTQNGTGARVASDSSIQNLDKGDRVLSHAKGGCRRGSFDVASEAGNAGKPQSILDRLRSWVMSALRAEPPSAPRLGPARAPCKTVPMVELPPAAVPLDVSCELAMRHDHGSTLLMDDAIDRRRNGFEGCEVAPAFTSLRSGEMKPYFFSRVTSAARAEPPRAPRLGFARAPCQELQTIEMPPPAVPLEASCYSEEDQKGLGASIHGLDKDDSHVNRGVKGLRGTKIRGPMGSLILATVSWT